MNHNKSQQYQRTNSLASHAYKPGYGISAGHQRTYRYYSSYPGLRCYPIIFQPQLESHILQPSITLTNIGTPCRGLLGQGISSVHEFWSLSAYPRTLPAARSASRLLAIVRASGLISPIACSIELTSRMRSRYAYNRLFVGLDYTEYNDSPVQDRSWSTNPRRTIAEDHQW